MTLPRVSIWSLFRNDAGDPSTSSGCTNIARYRRQLEELNYPANLLRFYFVEGDSDDNTFGELQAWGVEDERITVVQYNTGIERMRHTPHPDRLRCLAETGNAALDALATDKWGEWAMLIESDLQFKPGILKQLLTDKPDDAAVIAPYIWLANPDRSWIQFYDVWAFRTLDGQLFPSMPPSYYAARFPTEPFEVESVGSMVLMDASLLYDGVRYTAEEAIRGICLQYRERGLKVYADPTAHVLHPFIKNPYPMFEPKANESQREKM